MQPGLGVPVGSRGMGSEPGGSGITTWGWVGARHRTACGEAKDVSEQSIPACYMCQGKLRLGGAKQPACSQPAQGTVCGGWGLVHPTPPPLLSICTILPEESISSKPPALFRMVKLFKLP